MSFNSVHIHSTPYCTVQCTLSCRKSNLFLHLACLVNALVGVLIKLIPPVALATEAAYCIHAGAVLARARHQLAFVNLMLAAGQRIDHAARAAKAAQRPVVLAALPRAGLVVE